jgi:hypothetical protein
MKYREISTQQARGALAILQEECRYRDAFDGEGFVRAIVTVTDERDHKHICHEFRFQGALGFGGKFRNNGNNSNTPYVDCYPEDETPARREMIAKANARLSALFNAEDNASKNSGAVK